MKRKVEENKIASDVWLEATESTGEPLQHSPFQAFTNPA